VANAHYLNKQVAADANLDHQRGLAGDFIRGLGKRTTLIYLSCICPWSEILTILVSVVYGLFTEQFRQRFAVPVDYRALAYPASRSDDAVLWTDAVEPESVSS
jgi:hypothetical protein